MDSLFNFSLKKTKTGIMDDYILPEEAMLMRAYNIKENARNSIVYLKSALDIHDGADRTDAETRQMHRELGEALQIFHEFYRNMLYLTLEAWRESQKRLPEDQRDPRPPDSLYRLMKEDDPEVGEFRTGRQGMQDAVRERKAYEAKRAKSKKVAREATRRMKKEIAQKMKERSMKVKPITGGRKGKLKKTNKRKTTRKRK